MNKRALFLASGCAFLMTVAACGTSGANAQNSEATQPVNNRKTSTVQEVSASSYNGFTVIRLDEQIALCSVLYYPSCGLLQPGDKISYKVTNPDPYSGAISEVIIETRAAR